MNIDSLLLIEELSNAGGISGFEDEVLEVIRKSVGSSLKAEEDGLRNLYLFLDDAEKPEGNDRPVIMIDAHSDEIGFMIQSVKSNGLIKIVPSGGWFSQNVPAHRFRIRMRDGGYTFGVIATKPPHFMSVKEKETLVSIENMLLDVGASSREEVNEQFQIDVGAPVIPDVDFSYNPGNGVMMGKAFDNRLGCAAVVDTLFRLKEEKLHVIPVGSISAQEEVGLRGARVTANRIAPDAAIVFEGTPADDGWIDEGEAQSVLHRGPQIRHCDGSMIGNPRFIQFVKKIAEKNGLPFQEAVRRSGGTNAGAIHLNESGVPVIVIGIPARYIHSHYGFASFSDYQNAVKWAVESVKNISEDIIRGF
jgi:putative aminopeptidase FrvX